jgi:methyl-accepting chemotaxis protein
MSTTPSTHRSAAETEPSPVQPRGSSRADPIVRLQVAFGLLLLSLGALAAVLFVEAAIRRSASALAVMFFAAVAAGLAFAALHSVVRRLRAVQAAGARLAAGDLTIAQNPENTGSELQQAVSAIAALMFRLVADVRRGTMAVASMSGQIKADGAALASRTESQAGALQQTAASVEQLTATVMKTAENANLADRLVATALVNVQAGTRSVDRVVQAMEAIRTSSARVAEIISLIDGIALQTNILALNAAIEAAQAGEKGRGFAVVAGEVRQLAQRSAAAAREVNDLVSQAMAQVNLGVGMAGETGQEMKAIDTSIGDLSVVLKEIAVASQEQSLGIRQANQAIAHIDEMTQRNASLVEEAASAASTLHQHASTLSRAVAGFRLGAREFGSADDAVRMVKEAIRFSEEQGRQALIDDVNLFSRGRFIDRDLYLVLNDIAGNRLAHGANARVFGNSNLEQKDADGKPFVKEMNAVARRPGQGWVDYKFPHPVTGEVMQKSAYVEKSGDLVLICGCYRNAAVSE